MKHHTANQSCRLPSGFTLVEMLVSVTLVLLMMTMFATIFGIATDSVSTQRAIAENDQKIRALTTVIRADFAKRTFRNLQPFSPGETSATSPTSFGNRLGYFYISTNAPDSSLDDLIQFTISVDQISENTDQTLYYGRANQLMDRELDPTSRIARSLSASPNQPELDDGELRANAAGSSSAAEVCYFIRNGNLYRRQLLIREPLAVTGEGAQPISFAGRNFFSGYSDDTDVSSRVSSFDGDFRTTSKFTNDFYANFDYSVFPNIRFLDPSGPANRVQTAGFAGLEALSNENSSAAGASSGPIVSLGKPVYRFGFDFTDGLSREHLTLDSAGLAQTFMGRFLHAETSAPNFNYPQQFCNVEGDTSTVLKNGNPFNIDNARFTYNSYGIIRDFDNATSGNGRGGSRAQEDLLLANVHEMKIELWDARRGQFVTPGYGSYNSSTGAVTGLNGDFHVARNLNSAFGADNRLTGTVFDTWHPDNFHIGRGPLGLPATPQTNLFPPYQPYTVYPPEFPAGPAPQGTGSSIPYWTPATVYTEGDVVFPARNQVLTDADVDGNLDLGVDTVVGQGYQFLYECIAVDELDSDTTTNTPGTSDTTAPSWPTTHGRRFSEGEEGTPEVTWQAIDNRRSLKAIRMTLRFLNAKTDSMRQLTLVLPLAHK